LREDVIKAKKQVTVQSFKREKLIKREIIKTEKQG
jgi:hypothetical protein